MLDDCHLKCLKRILIKKLYISTCFSLTGAVKIPIHIRIFTVTFSHEGGGGVMRERGKVENGLNQDLLT